MEDLKHSNDEDVNENLKNKTADDRMENGFVCPASQKSSSSSVKAKNKREIVNGIHNIQSDDDSCKQKHRIQPFNVTDNNDDSRRFTTCESNGYCHLFQFCQCGDYNFLSSRSSLSKCLCNSPKTSINDLENASGLSFDDNISDGMEAYFREANTVIFNEVADDNFRRFISFDLNNGASYEAECTENNLNTDVTKRPNKFDPEGKFEKNRTVNINSGSKNYGESSCDQLSDGSSMLNGDDVEGAPDHTTLRNISFDNEESLRMAANIVMHCSNADNTDNGDVSPEMDYLELDYEPGDDITMKNSSVDSDLGSDSRATSPQPSSDDGGNENKNITTSCYNNVNHDDMSENNDLGIAVPETEVENRFVQSLSFHNQLSQNIKAATDDSDVHNLFIEEPNFPSDNSNNFDAELFDTKANDVDSADRKVDDAMEYEDMNLHSASSRKDKKLADKQAVFTSKQTGKMQTNSDICKIMDVSNCNEKVMIWSEAEAYNIQVSQISQSACGATAVINVLLALNISIKRDEVSAAVKTRLRADDSNLTEYLFSRSNAGATHNDLITAVHDVTDGAVYGRFFHLYPPRRISLMNWIADWIKIGAIPVVTLNLQQGILPGQLIPDSWHHQMVFGVGPKGIYVTNPLECISPATICKQMCSESVLLVRRNDVIRKWDDDGCDLTPILLHPDSRWTSKNVIGQIVNVIREASAPLTNVSRRTLTNHISIPAAYKSGVTLFTRKDVKAYHQLLHYQELT